MESAWSILSVEWVDKTVFLKPFLRWYWGCHVSSKCCFTPALALCLPSSVSLGFCDVLWFLPSITCTLKVWEQWGREINSLKMGYRKCETWFRVCFAVNCRLVSYPWLSPGSPLCGPQLCPVLSTPCGSAVTEGVRTELSYIVHRNLRKKDVVILIRELHSHPRKPNIYALNPAF